MTVTGLTDEQLEQFDQEGVLCIPDFLSESTLQALMDRSHQLLRNFDLKSHPKTKFNTGEEGHIGDQYFFDSSDKISFFFDIDAFDDNDQLKYPKEKSINKIGHGLHMLDDEFGKITYDERVKAIARSLKFEDPRVLQSMAIFKHPVGDEEGARLNEVPPHTDGTFLFTNPQSAIGFWFALEDCTPENGCLSYSPGSQKTHPITSRFVKKNGGKEGCSFIPVEGAGPTPTETNDYKLVECKAGSLVLIHNTVLHKSENNCSDKSRFAYTFHVIEGTAEYDNLNWLQVPPCEQGGTEFSKLYTER